MKYLKNKQKSLSRILLCSSAIALAACSGGGGGSGTGTGGNGPGDGGTGSAPSVSIVTPMTVFKAGGDIRISGKNLKNLTPVFASANLTPSLQTDYLVKVALPAQPSGKHNLTLNGKDYSVEFRDSYTKLSSGLYFTCGILPDKTVECWGRNNTNQLSNIHYAGTNSATPVPVEDESGNKLSGVTDISAGESHVCAVATAGKVACWGFWGSSGYYGHRGDNNTLTTTSARTFNYVKATATTDLTNAAKVASGKHHTCVLMNDTNKSVKCWGYGRVRALGAGSVDQPLPISSNVTGVTQIVAGQYHTCALKTDGKVWCWGKNDKAQLGIPTSTSIAFPTLVAGLAGVKQISAKDRNT